MSDGRIVREASKGVLSVDDETSGGFPAFGVWDLVALSYVQVDGCLAAKDERSRLVAFRVFYAAVGTIAAKDY